MADEPQDLISGSIDDFLLALADGIHKTQRQLSQLSVAVQPGQPPVTYQLPKLDFEFKVSFELAASQDEAPGSQAAGLRLRPAAGQSTARSAGAEAASVIRGSFVAVPALGGKPPPIMEILLEKLSSRRFHIAVQVTSAAGEAQQGVPVEFNIDRRLSAQLSPGVGMTESQARKAIDADLWDGRVETNERGHAETTLNIGPDTPVGSFIAVLIDALSKTRTVIFKVEG